MGRPRSFDRLVGLYRPLELLAFGHDLERARFTWLPELRDCRRILVLGDGDGRGLARLAGLAPAAAIDSFDLSAAMLARARQRVGSAADRIQFRQADLRRAELPARHYDAVVTCFFLDCFDETEIEPVIARIAASLQPGARWLWSDFVLPPRGPARWRARVWLATMYFFFRWQTGISASELPPSEALIAAAGFRPRATCTWQWGMLRSTVFATTAA